LSRSIRICAFAKSQECRCGCKGRCTWDGIWNVIVWNFVALFTRVYPRLRHDGVAWHDSPHKADKHRAKRFANGITTCCRFIFSAMLGRLRGDWAFLKNVLGLGGWKDGNSCCWMCPCDHDGMHDASESASWRQRLYTQSQWLAHVMLTCAYVMPLLGVPGFSILFVAADLMHAGDLGVILYLLGNVLWDLFGSMGGTYANPNGALSNILNLMRMASKALSIQVPVGAIPLQCK
jgi:hypothetical protein